MKLGIKETSRYDRGKTTQGKKTKIVVANDPEDRKGALKSIGGSQSDHWNNTLSNQAVQALWLKHSDSKECDRQLAATVAALIGIAPKDELEGMMAAQLIRCTEARSGGGRWRPRGAGGGKSCPSNSASLIWATCFHR